MTGPWPARDGELRRLFREGLTCESMAAVMGLTKGAIVGRLHRLDLYREHRQGPRKARKKKPSPWKPQGQRAPPCAPLGQSAELLRLNPDGCRWGVAEIVKHRHLFCGMPRFNGSSYCERHWRRSLGRGRP